MIVNAPLEVEEFFFNTNKTSTQEETWVCFIQTYGKCEETSNKDVEIRTMGGGPSPTKQNQRKPPGQPAVESFYPTKPK